MAEVLFTHSYFLRFDQKQWETMQPYPPLGTLYAAAYVRQAGYSVALFDSMLAQGPEQMTTVLAEEQPRFTILFEDNFNYLSKMCLTRMREAAFIMIDKAAKSGSTVIVSGSDATDHVEDYMDHGAQYILAGEGEATLVALLEALTGRTQEQPEEITGLVFRKNDQIMRTPPRGFMKDLDVLPDPARDLIDMEAYRLAWRRRHGYFSMNMVTTRGCPFKCNWCAKPIYGNRYNSHSPEYVAQLMLDLKGTYGPDHIWFADDIFGLKPDWVVAFSKQINALGAQTPYKIQARVDLLDEEVVTALKSSGCAMVWVGAESGAQHILDAMDKGTSVTQIRDAAERLHRHGIEIGFFIQFGYPGETREDIDRTIDMVTACRPDDIGISVSYPLPGTTFYERVKSDLQIKKNWTESDDLAMMFQGSFDPEFYRILHTVVHARFRAQKGWRALMNCLRTPLKPGRRRLQTIATGLKGTISLAIGSLRLRRLQGNG